MPRRGSRTTRTMTGKPRTTPSVQATFVDVLAAHDDVLVLRHGRCRAVLEVAGLAVPYLDETEQEVVVAALNRLWNGLTHPVQLVVRSSFVDLNAHAQEVEAQWPPADDQALSNGPAGRLTLAILAHEYSGHVRGLAAERHLIQRRCYVVIPADDGLSWPDVRRQLAQRGDELAQAFTRAGMPARRLTTVELVALHASWWRPGASRIPWAPDGDETHSGDALARTTDLAAILALLTPHVRVRKGLRTHLSTLWDHLRRRHHPPDAAELAVAAALTRGVETVPDRIAPAGLRLAPRTLRLEDTGREVVRTLALTGYPRTIGPAWLAPLLSLDATVDVSLHIEPLEVGRSVKQLDRRLARLEGRQRAIQREERIDDPDVALGVEDISRMRDAVRAGHERLFAASLSLHLRAPTDRALGDHRAGLHARVEGVLAQLLAEARVTLWEQDRGFKTSLPEGVDHLRRQRTLNTSALARTVPFCVSTASSEQGIVLGIDRRTGAPVRFYAHDPLAFNANFAILAPPGSGKSYLAKLLLLRHLLLGVEGIVIDPEGEYRRLAQAVGGQIIQVGRSHLNPFDLAVPAQREADDPDPVDEQVTALLGLLGAMVGGPTGLTEVQRALLDTALHATYRLCGIRRGEPTTWTMPSPLLRDLVHDLQARQGEVAATLATLLAPYVEGSQGHVFDRQTDVDLASHLVVFDLREVHEKLLPVAVQLATQFVWSRVRAHTVPRLLVVDEIRSLLQYEDGARFLGEMARRARKHYLGLVTATQDVSHLLDTPSGRDVLTTAAVKVLLKQEAVSIDKVQALFNLPAADRVDLLAADKGEGLLLSHRGRVALTVEASPAEHRLITTAPAELLAAAGVVG